MRLTPTEFSLLLLLVKNAGHPLSSDFIYETVWNVPIIKCKNALQTAISKLRRKIKPTGYQISVHRDEGYVFRKSIT